MKKILIRVYLVLLSLCIISLIVLSVLGSKSRVGYLEISSFNVNDSYSNNYIYNFQVKYYDKVFRNSDIYGVYLVANSFPEYVKEIKMDNNIGTPFGNLISSKEIRENKIDNVKYTLKVKIDIYLLFLLLNLVLLIFLYTIDDLYLIIIRKIFINHNSFKYLFLLIIFFVVMIPLYCISIDYTFIFIVLLYLIYLFFIIKNYFCCKKHTIYNNIEYKIILLIFLIFLITPNFIYNLIPNIYVDNYENRNLKEKPNFTINNYTKEYEDYFNDHLPFRNNIIYLKRYLDYYIFNDLIDNNAILGKESNLFIKADGIVDDFVGNYYFNDKELEIVKDNLLYVRDKLRKSGIDFVLMICPDKNFIYSEYMPDYIKRKTEFNSSDKFIEYIKNNTDIKIVYPKQELLKYKDKYILYYKYSDYSHWTRLGAYIGYYELMKLLNFNIPHITNSNIKLFTTLTNNYFPFIGTYEDDYIVDNYHSNGFTNEYSMIITNNYIKYEAKNYSENKKNIFFIRDSYIINMSNYIVKDFNKSIFVSNFYDITNRYSYIINEDTDVVVFETVGRYFYHRLLGAKYYILGDIY